jgi:hypothetical protein
LGAIDCWSIITEGRTELVETGVEELVELTVDAEEWIEMTDGNGAFKVRGDDEEDLEREVGNCHDPRFGSGTLAPWRWRLTMQEKAP